MPMTTLGFPIYKAVATGNDFLIIDLLDEPNRGLWHTEDARLSRPKWVQQWCDRHTGLGADGAVFLEPDPQLDLAWDFYNSDGGNAEMCGNAARAVSLYMAQSKGKNSLTFTTRAGSVQSWVHSDQDIEVRLPPIAQMEWNQSGQNQVFDFVRAGVPHAVVRVEDLSDREVLRALAHVVKAELRFRAEGVNVTFVQPLSDRKIRSVTFERGVEDFTKACGTGAVAAAYSMTKGKEQQRIEVQVPGGTLFVIGQNGRPHLRGPAQIVAVMHLIQGVENVSQY